MLDTDWIENLLTWLQFYAAHLTWSAAALLFYIVVARLALPKIEKGIDSSNLKSGSKSKAYHVARVFIGTVTIAVLLIIWGIDFSGLLVLSTSIITLTGVALFASWSLLSNVTSYFVLLFHNSFRRGNFIRVIDADNYIEGYISEVNLFNTKLITEDREIVVYPNNLILTRPTIINPRNRWQVIGKFVDKPKQIIEQSTDE